MQFEPFHQWQPLPTSYLVCGHIATAYTATQPGSGKVFFEVEWPDNIMNRAVHEASVGAELGTQRFDIGKSQKSYKRRNKSRTDALRRGLTEDKVGLWSLATFLRSSAFKQNANSS